MRMTVTFAVRGQDRATLERRTKRLRQRAKDLGAELRLLRWEQRAGWLAVAPLRRPRRTHRGQSVETGTVARTYPFSAGTLAIEGGAAAAAPMTFTRAAPRNKNGHMCWYGTSGAGKDYSLRVLPRAGYPGCAAALTGSMPCDTQGQMNVLEEELHMLVDGLDGSVAKQQLHTLVDDLNEEQARETLTRLRDLRRRFLDHLGFYT